MLNFLPSAVVKLLLDGAFSYHPKDAEFHIFYHESYNHSFLSLQKGIPELVRKQMTNQLSASSGTSNSRHFLKEQSIMRSRDTQSTSLLNLQKLYRRWCTNVKYKNLKRENRSLNF